MGYSDLDDARLVQNCARSGESEAWEEFVSRYQPFLARIVIRTAKSISREAVDDLVQEIFLKLCTDHARLLRNFEYRRPEGFHAYLKMIAVSTVYDNLRRRNALRRGGAGREVSMISEETAGAVSGHPEQEIFLFEIERLIQRECARDRYIFWLYYREGFSAKAIADKPGIDLTMKGVESVLQRLCRQIRIQLIAGAHSEEKGTCPKTALEKEEAS